jgi:hypothetical protein
VYAPFSRAIRPAVSSFQASTNTFPSRRACAQATYNRLEEQYNDLENRWAVGIMRKFARH